MISTIASLFVTLIIAIYLLIKELKTPRKYFGLKIWLTGTLTNFLGIIISLVNFLTLESVPLIYLSYLLMTLGFGLIDLALFKFVNKAISLKRVVFTFSPVVILLLLTAFNNLNLYLTFVVFVIIYYSLLQISIINYKNEIKMKSNWLTFTIIQMFLVIFLVVYLLLRLIANHANVSEMINYENVNVIVKSMALLFLINAVLIFLSLEVSLLFSEPKTKLFLKMLLELSDNVSIVISEKNNKIVAVHNDFVQLVKCDHKDELIKLDLSDLLVGYENYQDAKNNFKDGNTFLTKLNFYTKDNNSVGCDVLVRYLELKNDNYYLLSCLNDNLGANQYKKLAYEDELTKLPNRRKINEVFTSFKIEKKQFYLIMIDIDSFKKLNDEKGHLYGDQILFEIGKNLSKYNSANSIAARYGGDEFLLLFTAADNKKLRVLKSELKCLFNHQIIVDGKKEMIRVSLGSASYPKDGKTLNELIFKADKNLYSVKRKHNN